jgi:hypothetical protein
LRAFHTTINQTVWPANNQTYNGPVKSTIKYSNKGSLHNTDITAIAYTNQHTNRNSVIFTNCSTLF